MNIKYNMNPELKVVFNAISIPINGIFMYLGLSEFYDIYILKNHTKYPFGSGELSSYYYKTTDLYSIIQLSYGSIFLLLLCIGLWNLKGNKMNGYYILIISFALIFLQIFHALI